MRRVACAACAALAFAPALSGCGERDEPEPERRAGLATYTAVVATNAKRAAGRHRDEIRRILRSVRGRPVKRPGR